MHNLALALHDLGHQVSGSDDQIYEPARSRLSIAGIIPAEEGWQASRITPEIDLVILGMHAKAENPELIKSLQLGIPVQSFPNMSADCLKIKSNLSYLEVMAKPLLRRCSCMCLNN